MSTEEASYPEHEKLAKISGHSNEIGRFLDWLQVEKSVGLGSYQEGSDFYHPHPHNKEKLLAEFYEIDLGKIEAEKLAMLEECRNMTESKTEGLKGKRWCLMARRTSDTVRELVVMAETAEGAVLDARGTGFPPEGFRLDGLEAANELLDYVGDCQICKTPTFDGHGVISDEVTLCAKCNEDQERSDYLSGAGD